MAGLYLLQQAEFLFAVQIVLYVGGIMVLFLFVIMLVNLDQAAKQRQFNRQWVIALAVRCRGGRARSSISCAKEQAHSSSRRHAAAAASTEGNTEMIADRALLANICCRLKLRRCCCWWR